MNTIDDSVGHAPSLRGSGALAYLKHLVGCVRSVFPISRMQLDRYINFELEYPYRVELHREYVLLEKVARIYIRATLRSKELTVYDLLQRQSVRDALRHLWITRIQGSARIALPLRDAERNPLRPLCLDLIERVGDTVMTDWFPPEGDLLVFFHDEYGIPQSVRRRQALPIPTPQ